MKYILLCFILIKSIFANDFIIDEKYFIDTKNNLTIKEILNNNDNFMPMGKDNFGIIKNNLWLHLKIKNSSSTTKTKRIYNRRAALSYIDVFITKNKNILKKYSLGLMRTYKQRDNIFRVSYFDLNLKQNETVDIFIKQKTFGAMETKWHMLDINDFFKYFNIQTMIYFSLLSILCITSISSFIFFIVLKNSYYLIYTLFTTFSILYQLAVSGILYELQFPLYFITIGVFAFPYIALIFVALFPLSFFEIKNSNYKILIFLLKFLLLVVFSVAFLNLFYPVSYNLLYNTKYANIVDILIILLLLILSIKIFLDKKQGSSFYLISNVIMFSSFLYFALGIIGFIPNNVFYYYSLTLGSISQDFFIALILIQTIYLIKIEQDKNNTLLNEYSKLTFIGQTILNISHQWKTPINSIFNSINHIEAAKEFNDPNLNVIIDKNLKNIKNTTNYLNDIALSQLDFSKTKQKKEDFNLHDEINFIINLINSELSKKTIKVNFDFDRNLTLFTNKNYFLNVLMVLFENSYRFFEIRKIENPKISIIVRKNEKETLIIFKDNALGVNKNIEKIFDKNYSLNDSTGLGLFLAKEIITHKLNGNIFVENEKEGLAFHISLNTKES